MTNFCASSWIKSKKRACGYKSTSELHRQIVREGGKITYRKLARIEKKQAEPTINEFIEICSAFDLDFLTLLNNPEETTELFRKCSGLKDHEIALICQLCSAIKDKK